MEFHRGKKGITLDLKRPEAVKIVKELAKVSDVVIENFRAGVMDRLGIGYEDLKKVNPRIIFASITGFGQYGPLSSRPSFDSIAQAMSGYMEVIGEQLDPEGPPVRVPEAPADSMPGTYAALSILAALYCREVTGIGQRIDIAQRDTMMYLTPSLAVYLLTGMTRTEMDRNYIPDIPGVTGTYKAKKGYVRIVAMMGRILDRLYKYLDKEYIDTEYMNNWVGERTVREVVDELVKADVPVAPILTVKEALEHPQTKAREMIVEVDHPTAGKVKIIGFPMKFSETPLKIEGPSPLLGQHNEEILTKLLGYTKEEYDKLKKEGVL